MIRLWLTGAVPGAEGEEGAHNQCVGPTEAVPGVVGEEGVQCVGPTEAVPAMAILKKSGKSLKIVEA